MSALPGGVETGSGGRASPGQLRGDLSASYSEHDKHRSRLAPQGQGCKREDDREKTKLLHRESVSIFLSLVQPRAFFCQKLSAVQKPPFRLHHPPPPPPPRFFFSRRNTTPPRPSFLKFYGEHARQQLQSMYIYLGQEMMRGVRVRACVFAMKMPVFLIKNIATEMRRTQMKIITSPWGTEVTFFLIL